MTAPVGRAAAVLDNLAENALAVSRLAEKRLGHVSELAETVIGELAAAGEVGSPRALLSAASSVFSSLLSPAVPPADGLPRHRAALSATLSSLSATDRAYLAGSVLAAAERVLGRPLAPGDFADGTVPPPEVSRLVCVRNPHTERALLRFLPLIGAPTVADRRDFTEVVDDVRGGHADYAVLPLRSGGVALGSVSAMLEEHGLAVLATVTLDTEGGEAVFGLLGRRSVRLGPPTHFLFTSALADVGLSGLFAAVEALPVLIERCEPLPTPEGEDPLFRLAVRGEEAALVPFLVYLSLFVPGYIGHGFYFELA